MTLIQYEKGDIFDSKAQVIVNTVNCKGVMGKGLALAFKQRYPAMFAVYQQECKTGKLRIGRPTLYREGSPWILNFPTKDHWRFPSKLEYLEKGLEFLIANYKKAGITSIAFPKLGAQNGKLSWDDVGPLMAKYLSQLDIDVYIYIADDDKEYQADDNSACHPDIRPDSILDEKVWALFNELAWSKDRLNQEVRLSKPQAAIVANERITMEFKSLADFEGIEKIKEPSRKKIKKYIQSQKYSADQLLDLPGSVPQKPTETLTKVTKRKRKKSDAFIAAPEETLFYEETELVGQAGTQHKRNNQ